MIIKKTAAVLGAFCLLILSLAAAPVRAQAQQAPSAPGLVVIESTQTFEQTWSTLLAALDQNPGIGTIAQVDHAAAAASTGLTLENNRVVFFGNPALGTPLMQASRTTGIDLPQKMQVFEQDGRVFVSYNAPSYLAARHSTGAVASLAPIDGALAGLANTATRTEGAVTAPSQASPAAGAGLVTTTSANDFETTWTELIASIDASPASVAFTVDHSANSGGTLPPTRLVVFGNAAIGTPIMASSATAGIDLPLKMLVYEDDAGVTHVVSTAPAFVQARHGVGSVATVAAATSAIANFTAAATEATDVTETAAPEAADADADADAAADSDEAAAEDEVLGVSELAFTGNEPIAAALGAILIGLGGVFVVSARRTRH